MLRFSFHEIRRITTYYEDPRNTRSSNRVYSCPNGKKRMKHEEGEGEKKRRKFRSRRLAARITRGSGRFIRAARWNTTLGENCLENSLLHHGSCFPVTDILDRNLLENYFIILPFQSISSSVDHKYSNDQFSKSLVSFRNSCSSSKVRRHASNCRKSKATLACLRDDPGCCTQCLDKSYVPRCSESSQLYYL